MVASVTSGSARRPHTEIETVVAVLGVGRWGRHIVRDLALLGASVHAVDPDPAARELASALGAASVAERLEPDLPTANRLDGIVVATPASQHHRDLLALGGFDVPIACEKPLTVSGPDARRVVAELGDRLTVLHVWRHHPGIRLLGSIARSGRLGQITAVHTTRTNWTSPRTDVDPVWTLLPHDLSIGIEVLGALPPLVHAVVERIDDRAVGVWATFGEHPALVVEASTRSRERRRDVQVHGTTGVAVLHDGATHVQVLSGTAPTPEVAQLPFDQTPALVCELRAFLDHVQGGPAPVTDAAEGLAVVEAVERTLAAET